MEDYYIARICRKGHTITSSLEKHPDAGEFCSKCGSPGIDKCESCGAPIKGSRKRVIGGTYEPPAYCYKCGKPFPWTETKE